MQALLSDGFKPGLSPTWNYEDLARIVLLDVQNYSKISSPQGLDIPLEPRRKRRKMTARSFGERSIVACGGIEEEDYYGGC
jgi:hypothetical protein